MTLVELVITIVGGLLVFCGGIVWWVERAAKCLECGKARNSCPRCAQ